jgi:hypothetical protein
MGTSMCSSTLYVAEVYGMLGQCVDCQLYNQQAVGDYTHLVPFHAFAPAKWELCSSSSARGGVSLCLALLPVHILVPCCCGMQ